MSEPNDKQVELCLNEDCDSNHICYQLKGHKGPCYITPEQPKVGELPSLDVTEIEHFEGTRKWDAWSAQLEHSQRLCRERQLLAEQQVSAGLKRRLDNLEKWYAEECQRIGVQGLIAEDAEGEPFYLKNTRAKVAEVSLAEANAKIATLEAQQVPFVHKRGYMSTHAQIGDSVTWENMNCGKRFVHSGTVIEYTQKRHVLWATIREQSGRTLKVQANRIELSSRTHNISKIECSDVHSAVGYAMTGWPDTAGHNHNVLKSNPTKCMECGCSTDNHGPSCRQKVPHAE